MIRILRTLVCCAAVAGCTPALRIPDPPKEVRVPVAVPCLKPEDVPQRPSLLSDQQIDALDDKRAVIALGKDRRVRQGYQAGLEAAVKGCR